MLITRVLSAAALMSLSFSALADLSIANYQRGMQDSALKGLTTAYVSGMGSAYTFANSELEGDGQPKLFCQPRQLALNGPVLIQLLDTEIKNPLYKTDFPVQIPLLFALKRAFPC